MLKKFNYNVSISGRAPAQIAEIILFWLLFLAASVLIPHKSDAENLVKNGNFELADKKYKNRPAFWDLPDGLGIKWAYTGNKTHGKAIKMDTRISEKAMVKQWKKKGISKWDIPNPEDNPIATTYGLSFYSFPIKVEKNKAYRVSFDFKAEKPGAGGKLWIRGYGKLRNRKRRLWETVVFCRVKNVHWTHFSQIFHPTKYRHQVTEMKVMLYAYWPPSVYWFDNIKIEEVNESYKSLKKIRL